MVELSKYGRVCKVKILDCFRDQDVIAFARCMLNALMNTVSQIESESRHEPIKVIESFELRPILI